MRNREAPLGHVQANHGQTMGGTPPPPSALPDLPPVVARCWVVRLVDSLDAFGPTYLVGTWRGYEWTDRSTKAKEYATAEDARRVAKRSTWPAKVCRRGRRAPTPTRGGR
jgi:hypothetical protein